MRSNENSRPPAHIAALLTWEMDTFGLELWQDPAAKVVPGVPNLLQEANAILGPLFEPLATWREASVLKQGSDAEGTQAFWSNFSPPKPERK